MTLALPRSTSGGIEGETDGGWGGDDDYDDYDRGNCHGIVDEAQGNYSGRMPRFDGGGRSYRRTYYHRRDVVVDDDGDDEQRSVGWDEMESIP